MLTCHNKSQFADYDITPAEPDITKSEDGEISYTLRARRYSHWCMDENEEYIFLAPDKIKTKDDWYSFDKRFSNRDTAYIIMDPWSNMACDFLNSRLSAFTDKTVVPLAQLAAENGHKVLILTSLPNAPYNSKIAPKLQQMLNAGLCEIIYHEECSPERFSSYLAEQGIKKLVYCGFFSNMCVLLRPLGIVSMVSRGGFDVYFVPGASSAMEHADTWDSGLVHSVTTLLISQTQAMLLELDDIIRVLGKDNEMRNM